MEPERQIEIQLGHMCNNRCVFCVSGQRTADREAGPLPIDPVISRLRTAREVGHTKVTLLGGEPTLQPGFLDIVRETVRLGFEEVVIFTNGVKTARAEFVDEVLATGGPFHWRISLQGATKESHERTTRKPGSFGRIVRTLEHLRARDQPISVNMCVVRSNYEDVHRFPELLAPYGVRQLHLDLMRPLDAGRRTEEELRDAMPRHSDIVEPMRRMIAGFEPGFDVNLGNMPYCVAPDLSPWIHHDGNTTETIAIDGKDRLSEGWNKYEVKRRDKIHPDRCDGCIMRSRCSGIFETYERFYGDSELAPLGWQELRDADPTGRLVGIWARAAVDALEDGWTTRGRGEDRFEMRKGELRLLVSPEARGAVARYERFAVHHLAGQGTERELEVLAASLAKIDPPVHPLGPELAETPAPAIGAALARLRSAAPFGSLRWTDLRVAGTRAQLELSSGNGSGAELWFELVDGQPRGGYRVRGEAHTQLVEGLRIALGALRGSPGSA